ncbi:MAG: aldo/keto reductase [Chromatiales bacterium]|nr:aldo/keto reductase [Gammaproteobacteria bacterium]MBW6475529.1 aldo/keto reductase [Chromatiales bacterium]
MPNTPPYTRREILAGLAGGLALGLLPLAGQAREPAQRLHRSIPATGQRLPLIGMGSWISLNVGSDPAARAARTALLREFFVLGGGMIDSSPMYGSAEAVIGHALAQLGPQATLFSASKVWTGSTTQGLAQIADSHRLWGIERFDLLQVHNLVNWEAHLKTLLAMKTEGDLRYVGITTSHGRRHDDLEKIMRSQPIDFVQLTYNIVDRQVEQRILPLAAERGIAVIANRPYRGGSLITRLKRQPLPAWAGECDCHNWAQFLLKFIVSHPAVSCAIPATSRVKHLRENMGAGLGALPDPTQRARMQAYVASL